MENYKLFLDDERIPMDVYNHILKDDVYLQEWEIVRDANSFKDKIINAGMPDIISFDNDIQCFINDEEITGYMLAKWLINYCMDNDIKLPIKILAHSRNVVDRPKIESLFINARLHLK